MGARDGAGEITWAVPAQRSLPEMAAVRIVEAIRTGALKPGDRIIEATLAQRLGVSRGPLREALKALEANHLVESSRGRGTYVAKPSAAESADMVVMRATLEGLAARLVTAARDPAALAVLASLHAEIVRTARAGQIAEMRDLDWKFHERLCAASGNAALLRSWRSISNLVRLFLHAHPAYEFDAANVLGRHERFLAVLQAGDPDAADRCFRGTILASAAAGGVALPPGVTCDVEPAVAVAAPAARRPVVARAKTGRSSR